MFGDATLLQQPINGLIPDVDKRAGVTANSPTEEEESSRPAEPDNSAAPKPIDKALAVKNARQTEETCGPRCQRAENRNDADLVAQQSMAESTGDLVDLTVWQIFFGVVGLLMLGATLFYTRETASAGIATAKDTKRQADIAEAAMLRLERPYLFVIFSEPERLIRPGAARRSRLKYFFINHGKTPATLLSVNVRLQEAPDYPLRLNMPGIKHIYEVIEPGAQSSGDVAYVEGAENGTVFATRAATRLIFHGAVTYSDATGAVHTDGFCFRPNTNAASFRIEGGAEYNYRKTERPNTPS
ncbi:MAG: hypothetical protein RIM84_08085 [Alphaproteobacteria bacterium]